MASFTVQNVNIEEFLMERQNPRLLWGKEINSYGFIVQDGQGRGVCAQQDVTFSFHRE